MKRIILVLVILFSSYNHYSQSETKSPDVLRVITYNIWNGFDWGKDTIRQNKMITWIRSKKPDVMALQELCGYTEEKLLIDAKKWGHNYVKILKTDGYPVGLTSSKPIVLKEKARDNLWHGMLHCETWGIDFFVVHLSPADRNFRYKEAGLIMEKINNNENKKFLVLGDFNAHSPFDGDQDLVSNGQLERVRKRDAKSEKEKNLLDNEFDYSVMSSFLSLPLLDVTQRFIAPEERYTYPASALIGSWQTKEEVEKNKHRLDYILVSRPMAKICTNAVVFNGTETSTLSDHFPVMAEFELK